MTGGIARSRYVAAGLSFLFCLAIAVGQYQFRRFDDNALLSWQWVFGASGPFIYFLALVPALLVASMAVGAYRTSLPRQLHDPLLFFACYAAAAALWSSPEVNVDASRYFTQAKHLELYGVTFFFREWGRGIPAWTDLPTVPFLYGLIFRFAGESRAFIQALNALLFALTAVIAGRIGKTLWDEDRGWYAGLLLLAAPYLLIQTPLTLVDVPTMFFLTLSVHLFLRAIEAGGMLRAAAASVAVFLTACCKYSAWPMLSILPVTSAVYSVGADRAFRRSVAFRSLTIFLLSIVLLGAAIMFKFDVVSGQIWLLINFQKAGLERWSESYRSTFLFQVHPVIAVAAAVSLAVAVLKRDVKYLIAAWLPLLIIAFQIRRMRYTLPVLPFLALMASYALAQVRNFRSALVACTVAASLVTCFFAYLPFLNRWSAVNLKQAGEYLDTLEVDAVEVYPLPQKEYPINPAVGVPLLDLFTHKKIIYRHEPGASTPDKEPDRSRFRFSWEYQNPDYYEPGVHDAAGKKAVALILARPDDKIPPELTRTIGGLAHSRDFLTASPLFYSQTLVRIYW